MPTQSHTTVAIAPPGVYVPSTVIAQIDEALAALYGLIEAVLRLVEDEIPEGSEKRIICSGLVTWLFKLYHTLNDARLLFYTSLDANASVYAAWQRFMRTQP
jgi:hypothetical protein